MKYQLIIAAVACFLAFCMHTLPSYSAPVTNTAAGPGSTIINMKVQNLTLEEALNLVCKLAGLEYRIEGPIVIVEPKKHTLPIPPPAGR